jgi:thiamine kinase-like enzyme
MQVLALFANGRIEEWLNCCSISPQDMCSARMVPRIARLLRRFHGTQVDLPREPHAPWGVIDEWMAKAQQLQFTDPVKQVRILKELHMHDSLMYRPAHV